MALENQYDHPALCWDVASLDNNETDWKEDLQLVEQVSALMLLDDAFIEEDSLDGAQQEYEIQEVKSLYTFHLLMARLVFHNNAEMYETLNLLGKREECLEAWVAQASIFYADLGHLSSAMAHYGITLTELQQAKAMVEAITTARQQQQQRKGEAQNATQQRDTARRAINVWMKDFRAAARSPQRQTPTAGGARYPRP